MNGKKDLDKSTLYEAVKTLVENPAKHIHLDQQKLFTLFSVAFQYILFRSTKHPGHYIIRIEDSMLAEKLARKAMNDPAQVIVEKTVESAPKIDQMLYWLPEDRKLSKLVQILKEEKGTFFIFVNSKEKTFQLTRLLNPRGIEDATYIPSDLQQEHN